MRILLQEKVALITGASGFGIGTETARRLSQAGAHVLLNGRDLNSLNAVKAEIVSEGGHADVVLADVSDPEEVRSAFRKVEEGVGGIDILVSNAASSLPYQRVDQATDASWAQDIGVILSGAFYVSRGAVPMMTRRGGGKIIFVSSSAALRGTWGRSVHYTAAKAGLHGMTKHLALELAEFGISVNAVAPSQIDTPRVRKGGRRTDESLRSYGDSHVPLGRVGMPSDIANTICFLASDQAAYITGQVIPVDGGTSLSHPITQPQNNV